MKIAGATSEDCWKLDFRESFSWSYFRMVRDKEIRVGYLINIMKLCKWSCSQWAVLSSDIKNSSRCFPPHFTYYPSYQWGKIVLGTKKTSREVVLEKLDWSPAQARENKKLTKVKSVINGYFKKRAPLINGHIIFPRITIC